MFKYGLLILILCFTACKSVEKFAAPLFAVMLTPGFNPDLLQLQLGLHQYKLTNTTWPLDSTELNSFLKNIDMEPLRTNKYEVLEWYLKSDTVIVTYLLRYNASDSIEFKSLQGSFNLYLDSDSSLNSIHRRMTAEKTNDTFFELEGEWIMRIDKP